MASMLKGLQLASHGLSSFASGPKFMVCMAVSACKAGHACHNGEPGPGRADHQAWSRFA
jgi:hypothetical protein